MGRPLTSPVALMSFGRIMWEFPPVAAVSSSLRRLGRIGGGSFDAIAGDLSHILDFTREHYKLVFLDSLSGEVLDVSQR